MISLGFALVVSACGDDPPAPEEGAEGCDNLNPGCLWPFPSDAWVDDDGLALPDPLLPSRSATFSPEVLDRADAFGAASPIVFQLEGAEIPAGVEPFDSAPSLEEGYPTVVLDATTGARVPHWVETDFLAPDVEPPIFVIRPAVPLPRGTTIVIGVTGMTGSDGLAEATEPFAALRDSTPSRFIGIEARRAHFEEVVFPALESAGIARESLQLAWSFPVRSAEDATAPLVALRDAVFGALPADGPEYAIDAVYECDGSADDPEECHPSIRVIIDGTVSVPSFVEAPDALGVRLVRRGADGTAVIEGVEEWPFRLQLPHVAFDGAEPVPVMQYGHGFLGSRQEANNGWIRDMAERLGFAILACDMQGMNEEMIEVWGRVLLEEGGRFPELQELAWQGVMNQLVQQRMVATSLSTDTDPRLRRADGSLAWDPAAVWYYGNSQGGSVGTVVMALSLDVTRGVLGVPGSGYPFLLHRSIDFTPFVGLIELTYPFPEAMPTFLAVLGTGWDAFDPLTFAPHLVGDPLPGTPDHQVLYHVAKEDGQVQNEASFISARAAGATLMTPAVRPVPLLSETPYPASPDASLVEFDFGVPDDPTPLDPPDGDPTLPDEGNTHEWLRRHAPAQDQMVHFLRTGELIDTCGGAPCVHDGRP